MEELTISNFASCQELQNEFELVRSTINFHDACEISLSTLTDWREKLIKLKKQCNEFRSSEDFHCSGFESLLMEIGKMLDTVSVKIRDRMINQIETFLHANNFDTNYEPPLSTTHATLERWKKEADALVKKCTSLDVDSVYPFKVLANTEACIGRRMNSLQKGTFFFSIDDVWEKRKANYRNIVYDLDRTEPFPTNLSCYNLTKSNAESPHFGAADDAATRSTSSTARTDEDYEVDIFGSTRLARSQIAHLMPASRLAALTWYPVVSWVLPHVPQEMKVTTRGDGERYWEYVRKCILGTKSIGSTNDTTKPQSSVSNNKKPPPPALNNQTPEPSNCRTTGTGIKHFFTSLVRLKAQYDFFDKAPCLLFIPILTLDEVKNWKGGEYNAIVLAGKWPICEDASTTSAEVYDGIGAHYGGNDADFLASYDEIETATELFTTILCKLASACYPESSNLFKINCKKDYTELMEKTSKVTSAKPKFVDVAFDGKNLSKHVMLGEDEIAVPDLRNLKKKCIDGIAKVRKVVFRSVPGLAARQQDNNSTIVSDNDSNNLVGMKRKASEITKSKDSETSRLETYTGNLDYKNSAAFPACYIDNNLSSTSEDHKKARSGESYPINCKSDDEIHEDTKLPPLPPVGNLEISEGPPEVKDAVLPVAVEPILLTVKACANWMRRNSGFLVAAAGPKEYELDDGSMDYNEGVRVWEWPDSHQVPVPEIFIDNRQVTST